MTLPPFQDLFPESEAYRQMQPLRIPAGWRADWNKLQTGLDTDLTQVGGSSLYNATNEGRRFNIDVDYKPEFDPAGAFHLTVLYQPWPRSPQGRRLKDAPFRLGPDAECVHTCETRTYPDLIASLEHWIARCTVWVREGG